MKKLTRSSTNKVISGVIGGVGEYFDVDPVLFRLLYLILTIFTGLVPGVLGYLLALLVVPKPPHITPSTPVTDDAGTV